MERNEGTARWAGLHAADETAAEADKATGAEAESSGVGARPPGRRLPPTGTTGSAEALAAARWKQR